MFIRNTVNRFLKHFEHAFATHNRIEISASAILNNFNLFGHITGKQIIPVLKGNAYGHGIELVARVLKDRNPPLIAVDGYFEALRIRSASHVPVLIMGSILPENYAHMRYDRFSFVVHDEASIHALGMTGKSIEVHLECNTGMNRYGAKQDELIALTHQILSYRNLHLVGVMSHLADADGNDPQTVVDAVNLFDACVETIQAAGGHPTIFHIAQTLGSVQVKSKYTNAVRVGIGLYGVNPFPATHPLHKKLIDLQPALRLVSTITKIVDLKKGDRVSYNYTFTAPHDMKIGVLPLGYYEGVNRALSNVGSVKIGTQFAPIIGRVCMNHTMVSLEGINAKVGDEVTMYSNNLEDRNSINNIEREHHLFSYSLLTSLSHDVRRVLVD